MSAPNVDFVLAACALAYDTLGEAIYGDERLTVSAGEEVRSHLLAALRPYGFRECDDCGRVKHLHTDLTLVTVPGRARKAWHCTDCIAFNADFGMLLLAMSTRQQRTL